MSTITFPLAPKALLHTVLIPRIHILPYEPPKGTVYGFQLLQAFRGDLNGISLVGEDGNVVKRLAFGGVIDPVWFAILALEDDACTAEVELLDLDGDFVSGVCFFYGNVVIPLYK